MGWCGEVVVHKVSIEDGRGHPFHPEVDEGPGHGHEEEESSVVPSEEQRHQHHLVVVVLVPLFSRRRVQNEPDLIEPRTLQEEEEEKEKMRHSISLPSVYSEG